MKHKKRLCVLIAGIYILLCISYAYVIGIKYSYMGHSVQIDWGRSIFCTVSAISFVVIGYFIKNEFTFCLYNVYLIYYLFGELVFFQFNQDAISTSSIITMALLCGIFLTRNIYMKIPIQVKLSTDKIDVILFLIAIILFVPFVVFYYKYIDWKNLLFINVYETRALFREISNRITGYSMAPLVRVILPVLIVNYFRKKSYGMVILAGLMILYVYLCGALKSVFVGLLAIIFFVCIFS